MLVVPICANAVGSATSTTASVSIDAFTPAGRFAKVRCPWRRPPAISESPRISRMLPSTEPMIDALATLIRPAFTVRITMISSGALPNVAFSSAARRGELLSPACSVASPST